MIEWHSFFIPFATSPIEAEALAVYLASQYISTSFSQLSSLIVSDSKTTLDMLVNMNNMVPCLASLICTESSKPVDQRISFSWASKSIAHEGATHADSLARTANPRNSGIIRPTPSINTIKSLLKKDLHAQWGA